MGQQPSIGKEWYHLDRIVGAGTAWDWLDSARLHVHMVASDMGEAFVTEADRIAIVIAASANLNGRSLGRLRPPPEALFFGTANTKHPSL